MKKHILIILLLTGLGANAQNRFYNLTTQFDSVKVRKLLMTSVQTGSTSDSLLTKKPNGGVFKIDRSSFIFNTTTPQIANISVTGDISSSSYLKSGIGVKVAETVGFSTSSYAEFSNSRAKMGWNGTKGMIDIRGNDNSKSILFGGGADDYAVIFPTYFAPAITGGIALGNGSLYFSNAFLNDLRLAKTGLLKGNGTGANVSVAIAGTDYGTVSSFSKVDGIGITSSVANSTTTPVHTIAVDTTAIVTKANSNTLAQLQTRFNALNSKYVDLNSNQTAAGVKTWSDDGLFQKRVYARGFAFPINGTDPAYSPDPYNQLYAIPADQGATGLRFKASSAVSSPNVITDLIFNSTAGRKISFQNKDYTVAGLDDLTPYVKQSGNAFGTTMTVGTTDVNDLNLIRNGVVNFQINVNGANFPLGAKAAINSGGSNDLVRNVDLQASTLQPVSVSGTSQTMSPNKVYIPHNSSLTTFTLPTTATEGQLFQIVGEGSGGWRISQNSGQQIVGVNVSTTSGTTGYVQSTNANCTITIRCTLADTKFTITSSQGTLTIN